MSELGIPYYGPTTLNVDNQGTISFVINPINHARTKHINIKHHFMQEKIVSNEMWIQYCAMDDNLVDLLIKGLLRLNHKDLVTQLRMV